MKVQITTLEKLIDTVLAKGDYSITERRLITNVLLYAETSGKSSQGVVKLMGEDCLQKIQSLYKPRFQKETAMSAFIDGGKGSGILVSSLAMQAAIKKCARTGIAIVGTNNTFASTGAVGYYATKIATHGFVGIIMCGSPKVVAPFGSKDRLFGTNPIAVGFPTMGDPFVIDMATTALPWYEIIRAALTDEKLPENIAINENGELTTDPHKALDGAVLPFFNHPKGSAISMIIEILTGPLLDQVNTLDDRFMCGNLFIVINPELFSTKDTFRRNISVMLQRLHNARLQKGVTKIILPGEQSLLRRKEALASGFVEINDTLYERLLSLV